MTRNVVLSSLAGSILLVLSFATTAEPAPQATDLDVIEVQGLPARYGTTTTRTATRTHTPLRDVPQAVSVVSDELIRDQAMTGMADVVRYVPGVGMAQGEGHRDAPIFRGNVSTSDFFVDGVRDDLQYLRDLYNVDRVEVLKGPNSMIFGRGGAGGVINRVTRQANWNTHRMLDVQVGDYNRSRANIDIGQPVNDAATFRVAAMYEDSESFRDEFELERYGINPTVSLRLGENTLATFGYEYFRDERTTDRGVPSFQGEPLSTSRRAFFGDADKSDGFVRVESYNAVINHAFGNGITLRNSTRVGNYDKLYQNVYPGAVNAAGTHVALLAYNSATERRNLFNQTDLSFDFDTGRLQHTLLTGFEFGRQETENLRINGVFPGVTSSPCVAATAPPRVRTDAGCVAIGNANTTASVRFPQTFPGPDNSGVATVAALYVQDQIRLGEHWQAILGARLDRFEVDFQPRTGRALESKDDLFSPRVGLVYKPIEPVSVYASYSQAYVPRAGEQLNSLSLTNENLEPEKFINHELGAKWDILPTLSASAAVYRLDRTNVAVLVTPTVSQLVKAQRSEGFELELSGDITQAWSVAGGYAYQDARITRAVPGMPAGTRLAQVPRHSASLWNRYDFTPAWGVGLGVIYRGEVFATTSNTVQLPSFTRVDAAIFHRISPQLQLQVNVENLFDKTYYASAHSNDNIMPGAPRSVYLGARLTF